LSFVDYTIDDKNKFGLKVHLFSKSASTDVVHNLTVEFDEKTCEIMFGS